MVVIEGLSQDLIDLAEQNQNNNTDDDGGLSGGIVALIVILVILGVSVPIVIVIVYVLYKRRRNGRFDIFGSIQHRNYGTDYIGDNSAVNPRYTTTQELQTSQAQEMVSSDTEPLTGVVNQDESDSTNEPESIRNPNFDADSDKDTRL